MAATRSATRSTELRVGVGDRRQVHEPHAVGEQVARVVGGRDREAGLAASTGTDDRDDPAPRELGRDTAALVVPTHEPRAPPGQVHLDRPRLVGHDHRNLRRRGRSEQRRVVGEDPLVQPPQLRPRLDTELLGEHPAQLVEGRERRLLPAGHVERAQPPLPQRLAIGVLDDQRDQIRDDPVRVAGGEQDVEAVLLERHAHLGEPGADRLQPSGVGDAVVGCAPPATQCVVGDPQGVDGVGGGACGSGGCGEDLGVDRVRCDGQPVALLVAPHQHGVAARPAGLHHPAQSPDQRVQRTAGAGGRIHSPDGVDQRRCGQGRSHVDEQRGGDGLYAPATEGPRRPVNLDGKRSEVEEPHERDRSGAFHLRHSVV